MARKPYLEFSIDDRHAGSYVYRYGLKNGWFESPDKSAGCSACLLPFGKGPIEAHREDYSKIEPEECVIICCRCHRVLHMRDKYPEAWDFYRDKVREGYQWHWEKNIAPIANEMRSKSMSRAKLANEPRDRTVLDDINDGVLLTGTPEERRERMKNLHELAERLKSGGQSTLF
ncbi:MAG: hypothetical protein ACWGQW_09740 [bacterium]